jgi:hypothetical protein
MTEEYIIHSTGQRIKQLGYNSYHSRYRDISLSSGGHVIIPAYNQLWFIVGDPSGVMIESDYGIYDSSGAYQSDNAHEHRGEIKLINHTNANKRVKFIQVIIIN